MSVLNTVCPPQRHMKLQPDQFNVPFISAYEPGWIEVNGHKYTGSLVISSESGCSPWSVGQFEALNAECFNELMQFKPELIVFGGGPTLRFPKPIWLAGLMQHGIGVESMDTPAACRTYNILASEGRRVVAALLPLEEAKPAIPKISPP
jgi:uncharacterized protein